MGHKRRCTLNNRIEYAKAFLEASRAFLDSNDASGAAYLLSNTSSDFGPGWTWEVEEIHNSPHNKEERKMAKMLDEVLLEIATRHLEYVKTVQAKYLCATPYVWYLTLSLNKLGKNAPKELVNQAIGEINRSGSIDGRRVTTLQMLKSFLPVVSYFH